MYTGRSSKCLCNGYVTLKYIFKTLFFCFCWNKRGLTLPISPNNASINIDAASSLINSWKLWCAFVSFLWILSGGDLKLGNPGSKFPTKENGLFSCLSKAAIMVHVVITVALRLVDSSHKNWSNLGNILVKHWKIHRNF